MHNYPYLRCIFDLKVISRNCVCNNENNSNKQAFVIPVFILNMNNLEMNKTWLFTVN